MAARSGLLGVLAALALAACPTPAKDTGVGDADGDGFPVPEDCDDADAGIHPGAPEVCDGSDDDCDGEIDDGVLLAWYPDADGDGFGTPAWEVAACAAPEGYADNAMDCDDVDATAHPGAAEVCDGSDDDCDGAVDEDLRTTFFLDADGDGYGRAEASTVACEAPANHVDNALDCDDGEAAVSPAGVEDCDGVDDDCDGTVDEGATVPLYRDADGDGFGSNATPSTGCGPSEGWSLAFDDCDDTDPTVSPAGVERCGGADEDCDGLTDEPDALGATTWYADADADGWGDGASAVQGCTAPSGTVAPSGDCLDADATTWPGAPETCDGVDQDCDGVVDDSATDAVPFFTDADGDGWGTLESWVLACSAPSGTSALPGDCDDASATTRPGAPETCDGLDDDCDGSTDEEGAVDAPTWYADVDGDGWGQAGVPRAACDAPAGYVAEGTDCDDTRAAVFPGAAEVCNGRDDDCDGLLDADEADLVCGTWWYIDHDGDGYGSPDYVLEAETQPSGFVADATDCDDLDPTISPAADETCDGLDDDCDGAIDEVADADADGWDATDCGGLDCDDADAAVSPDAEEAPGTDADEDCDGLTDEITDGSLYFDGVDDLVMIGDAPELDLAGPISFEAWVMAEDAARDAPILAKEYDGGNQQYWFGVFYDTFGILLGDGVGWGLDARSSGHVTQLEWHHLASTWDGWVWTHYLDGVAVDTGTYGGVPRATSQPLTIGVNSGYDSTRYQGWLADVRLWGTCRTADEIQDNRFVLSDPTGLVGWWPLDDGSGQTATDASGSGFNGVLGERITAESRDPAWSTEAPEG